MPNKTISQDCNWRVGGVGRLFGIRAYSPTWLRSFLPYKNLGGTHPSLDWEIEQALKNHPTVAFLYYSFVGMLVLLNTIAIGALFKKVGGSDTKC
jgi:hypothetical protein